ncbi:MAG TPA: site-2 protease family protein, partial [Polyangiaceae bacterium]|nr:site-2 protease family protein [Polyangiaceae bacterium]
MSPVAIVLAVLGLGLLMVIHEAGHHFVARAFGMRVLRFSIGFGPVLWRHQPRGSTTVYQVALIPFLAYVQVAGMNPFEEVDP